MQKQTKFHHSVTELGNIQVRIVTEYLKNGKVLGEETYSDPMTVADTKKLDKWDDKTKDIVSAIIDLDVVAAFQAERQEPTGADIEETVNYDREVNPINCKNEEISIREVHRIFEKNVEKKKWYVRSWIKPGDDPSGNDVMSRAVAEKLHTPEVVEAYEAKVAENAQA